ncbi:MULTISPECIES: hypothetical protein [unclassified Anabaena]|uniref:hypothetical protein n=1 Tax=unclassified Anabaena TaxID=2619674 RepID=UPI000830C4F7|nr:MULTISPECIES: hypothetical protein [unclassified Anabaena]
MSNELIIILYSILLLLWSEGSDNVDQNDDKSKAESAKSPQAQVYEPPKLEEIGRIDNLVPPNQPGAGFPTFS